MYPEYLAKLKTLPKPPQAGGEAGPELPDSRHRSNQGVLRFDARLCRSSAWPCVVLLGGRSAFAAARRSQRSRRSGRPRCRATARSTSCHVQGNVYMLVGAGGNIAVQIGDEGVLVVDTGLAQMSRQGARRDPEAVATSRSATSSTRTSIPDHTGGNEVDRQGRQHDRRAAPTDDHRARERAEPDERAGRQAVADADRGVADRHVLPRGEGLLLQRRSRSMLYHDHGGAHRRRHDRLLPPSDVVVAGDIFITTGYPVIDLAERRQRPGRHRRPEPHPRHRRCRSTSRKAAPTSIPGPRPRLRRGRRARVPRHGRRSSAIASRTWSSAG